MVEYEPMAFADPKTKKVFLVISYVASIKRGIYRTTINGKTEDWNVSGGKIGLGNLIREKYNIPENYKRYDDLGRMAKAGIDINNTLESAIIEQIETPEEIEIEVPKEAKVVRKLSNGDKVVRFSLQTGIDTKNEPKYNYDPLDTLCLVCGKKKSKKDMIPVQNLLYGVANICSECHRAYVDETNKEINGFDRDAYIESLKW